MSIFVSANPGYLFMINSRREKSNLIVNLWISCIKIPPLLSNFEGYAVKLRTTFFFHFNSWPECEVPERYRNLFYFSQAVVDRHGTFRRLFGSQSKCLLRQI